MSSGHRQDVLIDLHGDWNWVKTTTIATTLESELRTASERFRQKLKHFRGLMEANRDRVKAWSEIDRYRTAVEGKTVVRSVYKHNAVKLPTFDEMYKRLTADHDVSDSEQPNGSGNLSDPHPQRKTAAMVKEGLLIQVQQQRIMALVKRQKRETLQALAEEITSRRAKVEQRIRKLRSSQALVAAEILPWVQRQRLTDPELECLFLPSDFTAEERMTLGLSAQAAQEVQLREGDTNDTIRTVKRKAQMVSAMDLRKQKDSRGQKLNTRTNRMMADAVFERNISMDRYNYNRECLINLQALSETDPSLPMLTTNDLKIRSTEARRMYYESRRADGRLWTVGGKATTEDSELPAPHESDSMYEESEEGSESDGECSQDLLHPGTGMSRRKYGYKRQKVSEALRRSPVADFATDSAELADQRDVLPVPSANVTQEGWIWKVGKTGKMSDEEISEWEDEGERVQFFRAEGELYRWTEQYETKHAEFERTIKSFQSTSQSWLAVAKSGAGGNGSLSYAFRQAAIYGQLAADARDLYQDCGEESIVKRLSSVPIHQAVEVFRRRTFLGLPKMVYDQVELAWDDSGKVECYAVFMGSNRLTCCSASFQSRLWEWGNLAITRIFSISRDLSPISP